MHVQEAPARAAAMTSLLPPPPPPPPPAAVCIALLALLANQPSPLLLCTQMVGTRSRKRAAEPTEEPATAVTVDQVLAAVDACRAAILEHAATVSTSQVLELCRQQLGLPDLAPLRPYRQAAKERALQLMEAQVRRGDPCVHSHLVAWLSSLASGSIAPLQTIKSSQPWFPASFPSLLPAGPAPLCCRPSLRSRPAARCAGQCVQAAGP